MVGWRDSVHSGTETVATVWDGFLNGRQQVSQQCHLSFLGGFDESRIRTRWRIVSQPDTVFKPVNMLLRLVVETLLHLFQRRRHLVGVSNFTIQHGL